MLNLGHVRPVHLRGVSQVSNGHALGQSSLSQPLTKDGSQGAGRAIANGHPFSFGGLPVKEQRLKTMAYNQYMGTTPLEFASLRRSPSPTRVAVSYQADQATFLKAVEAALPQLGTPWAYDGFNSTTLFLRSTAPETLFCDLQLDLLTQGSCTTLSVSTPQPGPGEFLTRLSAALDRHLVRLN